MRQTIGIWLERLNVVDIRTYLTRIRRTRSLVFEQGLCLVIWAASTRYVVAVSWKPWASSLFQRFNTSTSWNLWTGPAETVLSTSKSVTPQHEHRFFVMRFFIERHQFNVELKYRSLICYEMPRCWDDRCSAWRPDEEPLSFTEIYFSWRGKSVCRVV